MLTPTSGLSLPKTAVMRPRRWIGCNVSATGTVSTHTLSGGERQRVLLAACLAQEPKILLFDEPSTYLDVQQQLQCFSTLAAIAESGALCIAVTHDLNLALAHCTRLLVLHQGRIAADTPVSKAAHDPEWLSLLSPGMRLVETPEGRPWVVYR